MKVILLGILFVILFILWCFLRAAALADREIEERNKISYK